MIPSVGELAPHFEAWNKYNPRYDFSSLGGLWTILLFLGSSRVGAAGEALELVRGQGALFDGEQAAFFGVSFDPEDFSEKRLEDELPAIRFFADPDRRIAELYRVAEGDRFNLVGFLIDPGQRVAAMRPISRFGELLDLLKTCKIEEREAWAARTAPVLVLPRIFRPELCKALVRLYEQHGGAASGFVRQTDGKTVGVFDSSFKRRKDCVVTDLDIISDMHGSLQRNLLPSIQQAFGWTCTRIERNLIGCYDAAESGFFRPHRDNTSDGTAHRKFAVSLNLNEDYDGGELRFPEFGPRTYKPATGGAIIFSCSLLHEATPVTRGARFVFIPFLYDEEGARLRQQNLSKVERSTVAA